ncbi:major facilitator superfamily transporter [Fusarium oxysporum f. sp. phaseoli]
MSDVPKKALETDSGAAAETSIDNEIQGPRNTMDDETAALYPMGIKLALITVSLMLAVLCVALDNTIIAVAIPHITDQFHNLNDVGWYASAYLLTTCALQLLFGKLYALFSIKIVFLSALFVFELGSLICGIAPTSTALIIGRAIAGLGSAGIFTGALVTIAHTVAREKRPMFFGLLGGMYGIASVAGPLMGGAFTDHATWRWCFYINLPLGGVTAVVILLILKLPPKPASKGGSFLQVLKLLDPIGTVVFIPSIICLLLALQWGGVKYQWSNARIIVLFVIFDVLLIGFVTIQLIMKDDATVPPRIAGNRTIASAALFGFCIGGSFFILTYYIPIWFQVIKNTTAVRSGIYSLPMILESVVGIVGAGSLTTKLGHYAPFFIASAVIMSIGAGLITTFTVHTAQSKWVGYLFIYGFGVGLGFQQGGVNSRCACHVLHAKPRSRDVTESFPPAAVASEQTQNTDHSPKIISEHGPATVLHSHSASNVVASPILTNHGLTSDVVLELTKAYFDSLAYAAPMIHEDRYLESLSQPHAHQPPLCLQYVVMALGAYVSSCSPEFVESLYQNAKAHATSEDPDICFHCHRQGDEHDLVTLSHTQCWSLIANFEALHMMFTQALTSLCRGIRMAQALGLHQLGEESEGATLASAQERIILEEQRRTWWFLFLSDRLVCGTTGLPLCINQKDVTTLLPTSEKAFADGHSEPASPLKPLHSFTTLGSSILTARVFIANLFHRVLNHTSCISPGIHIKRDQHEFWDRHCRLDNELSLCTIKLPENARIGNPIYNRDAVIVNTELQAAIISLHRGAIWNLSFSEHNSCGEEVKRQQAHHSQERVMNSAQEIAHILRIAGAYSTTFMNPILIFSVYLSAFAFIEDFLDTQKNRVRILL